MHRRVFGWGLVLAISLFCVALRAETGPGVDVREAWEAEYRELAGQIERLKNWDGAPREWWLKSARRFGLQPHQLGATMAEGSHE